MTFNKIRHHKKAAFLLAFAKSGSLTIAAEEVDIDRTTHYTWLKDEEYRVAFEEAQIRAARELEDEAVKRAVSGSDVLLIFLLKCRNPSVFGDRQRLEHSGPGGGAISMSLLDEIVKRGSSTE